MATVNVNNSYYGAGTFFKTLQDCPTYIDDFKTKSDWMFAKGSVFGTHNIKVTSTGTTHAAVILNGKTINITLHKSWVEKIK